MRARGFTLMEVMISLGILAVLAAMVWGSFGPIFEAKQFVAAEADRYHGLRLAMNRMVRDIEMAYLSQRFDTVRYRERPTRFVGENSGEDDRLLFTTLSHERLYEGAKESDQAVVEYRIGRDPERRDVDVLFRRVKTVIDEDLEDDGTEVVLADGIEGLDIQYWDTRDEEWVDDWDTTDVERKNSLPQRVKITLIAKGDDGKPRKYTTQARVFLRFPMGS